MFISGYEDLFAVRPFDAIRRLQNELDWVFNAGAAPKAQRYPLLNIHADEEKVIVTAELPGVDPADLDIAVVGKVLTIKGERKAEALAENEKLLRRERAHGAFMRSIELPFSVEGEQVEATYKKGVLCVKLPRAERDRPRKISVN